MIGAEGTQGRAHGLDVVGPVEAVRVEIAEVLKPLGDARHRPEGVHVSDVAGERRAVAREHDGARLLRDRDGEGEIGSAASEQRMRRDLDGDVQVTVRPTVSSGLAMALHLYPLTVRHACGDAYLHLPLVTLTPAR